MSVYDRSISSAILIIVIVMIRAIALHKIPKKTFLFLWGVVICRLLIPLSIASRFSFYTGIDMLKQIFTNTKSFNTHPELMNIINSGSVSRTERVIGIGTSSIPVFFLTGIWMAGTCACTMFFIVTYIKCRREFTDSLPVKKDFVFFWLQQHSMWRTVQIRQSDKIIAPLSYGIFRPVILLPKSIDWTDEIRLRYILAHEFEHIRRFDTVTKLLLASSLSVHWFNPFVWVMYVLANRDIELSCDETVVRNFFGETTKSTYAMMLISMEEKRSKLTILYNSFSKNAIEERIVSIMKMKKISSTGIILALALVICLPVLFTTNSVGATKNNQSSSSHMSIGDSTGLTKISIDGGETWMDEAEYQRIYPVSDIDWWSFNEYKEWLEEQKKTLPNLIGGKGGYYDQEGILHNVVWTQEMVDETIALYEQILESIKNGEKVSKPVVNGGENVGYAINSTTTNEETEEVHYNTSEGTGIEANPNVSHPFVRYSFDLHLENGETKEFASYATKGDLINAVIIYCTEQVEIEKMTQQEANMIINNLK